MKRGTLLSFSLLLLFVVNTAGIFYPALAENVARAGLSLRQARRWIAMGRGDPYPAETIPLLQRQPYGRPPDQRGKRPHVLLSIPPTSCFPG